MYGRDPRIPTETILTQERRPYAVDVDDYKINVCAGLSAAWSLAEENIKKAQIAQKRYYHQSAKPTNVKPGDRVMIYYARRTSRQDMEARSPFSWSLSCSAHD